MKLCLQLFILEDYMHCYNWLFFVLFRVTVVKDKITRKSKGVAFVLFLQKNSAHQAVRALNNTQVSLICISHSLHKISSCKIITSDLDLPLSIHLKSFNFVTKVEKLGHLLSIDTLLLVISCSVR